jgi:hypothetical protein
MRPNDLRTVRTEYGDYSSLVKYAIYKGVGEVGNPALYASNSAGGLLAPQHRGAAPSAPMIHNFSQAAGSNESWQKRKCSWSVLELVRGRFTVLADRRCRGSCCRRGFGPGLEGRFVGSRALATEVAASFDCGEGGRQGRQRQRIWLPAYRLRACCRTRVVGHAPLRGAWTRHAARGSFCLDTMRVCLGHSCGLSL